MLNLKRKNRAGVIGGGSWGTAFAIHLSSLNIETFLWIREPEVYKEAVKSRENKTFLPGYIFPGKLNPSNDLKNVVLNSQLIFIAVPSQYCREIYQSIAPYIGKNKIIVSLTKGIEKKSLKTMSQVMEEIFNYDILHNLAVLSGPSFALEVMKRHPTTVVIASKNKRVAQFIQKTISSYYFRPYINDDIIGVELAGALKNVIAIAAGIVDGLGYGMNSLAALVTRGLAEMTRLGIKLGASPQTFSGLAGMGDLILTCFGKLSRNRYVGYELGKGKKINEITSKMKMVAEGINTTWSAYQLAKREKVEMPIIEKVYEIIYENKSPGKAVEELMSRKLKEEFQ
ncbi:NAD(P)-dependent glycerol-3-phosphate dehydrogenase [SCandidatus Aminicenantes bacterium Aminicenantia_JdfR_composite]|jgi:glycerol-3-phosphate dehydrogenase (NAD(P)+)|nr:NAD(P)-dependent glycerol-3-phosphate dehydrogenase [SCandidatus Aminicenantes bacterium Aminicenantia_JdfR_composite]MCP2597518.1 NAD(P)-dependent glycerol-3-phosphate dehydrogenase [Candidatus Aminicenantes bacterium AC-335-G13]